MKKINYIFSFLTFAIAWVFFAVQWHTLGITLSFLLLFAYATFYIKASGVRLSASAIALACAIVMLSLVFTVSAGFLEHCLSFTLLLLLLLYYVYTAFGNRPSGKLDGNVVFDVFRAGIIVPVSNMGEQLVTLFSRGKPKRSGKTVVYILIGIGIAIIPTAVITVLLASADEAFDTLLDNITSIDFDFWNLADIGSTVIKTFVLSLFIFGALAGNKKLGENRDFTVINEKRRGTVDRLGFAPAAVFLTAATPVCLVYLLFFFSQLTYFTSAFGNVIPAGFTYPEYARRGFFELCAVSVINIIIISVILLFCKKNSLPRLKKAYVTVISAFTLMLIATAASKMLMYIDIYGLTKSRIITMIFMCFLAVVFILIIVKQYAVRLPFAKLVCIIGIVVFIVTAYAGTDNIVVSFNVDRYMRGKDTEFDFNIVDCYKPATARYIIPLLDAEDEKVRERAGRAIYYAVNALEDEDRDGILDFNITNAVAKSVMKDVIKVRNIEA